MFKLKRDAKKQKKKKKEMGGKGKKGKRFCTEKNVLRNSREKKK